MKKTKKISLAIAFIVLIMAVLCFGASAKTYGDYEYTIVECDCDWDDWDDWEDDWEDDWDDGEDVDAHVCEKTAVITKYKGKSTSVKIPEEIKGYKVSGIESDAFYGHENIKSVTLPDTVSSLAYRAFGSCTSLENINIPENVTAIDPLAFDDCHKLKKISVSSDNESFSSSKAGVIYNKDKTAFLMYPSAKSKKTIEIRDGVETIGERALYGFENLTSIKLPSSLKTISEEAFYYCTGLKSIDLPTSLTKIGYCAFFKCTALESITIPKKVKEMESSVFENCTSLKSVKVANGVKYLPYSAFEGCINLKKVSLPESLTEIQSSAFEDCIKLKDITLPEKLTVLDGDAFENCASLETISVPGTVEYLGWSAFINCTSLKNVTLGKGIVEIGGSAFNGCTALETIKIPDSVKWLGGGTFAGCTSLKSVTLSKNMFEIYSHTFRDCSSLKSLTIPAKINYISDYVFEGCTNLKEFKVNSKNKDYSASKDGVLFNKNKTTLLKYPGGAAEKSYTIPKGVKEIRGDAFNDSNNIKSFKVASGNKKFSVDKQGVLFDKSKKNLVRYPIGNEATSYTIPDKTKTTSDCAFKGCAKLESVKIPDGFEFIGYYAFADCTALKSAKIPNNVESLVYLPRFVNCTSLETVSLPATLHSIDFNAFTGSSNLKEINVSSKNKQFASVDGVLYSRDKEYLYICPQNKGEAYAVLDGTKDISSVAFYESVTLKAMFIPDSIVSLESYMFDYCTALEDIYYEGTKKQWKSLFAWSVYNDPDVKVHYEHKHSYKNIIGEQATVEEGGKIVSQCVCGKINAKKDAVAINKIKTVKLASKEYVYTGKAITPEVIVKDSKGNALKKDKDYTVKYTKKRTKPGKYTVTVTFKDKYSGTQILEFTIVPAKIKLEGAVSGSAAVTLNWKKHADVTGYEVSYSTSEKFKKAKTATVKDGSAKKTTIKKLKKGTKYYFKVRAYKTIDGKKIYGAWSAVKSVVVR